MSLARRVFLSILCAVCANWVFLWNMLIEKRGVGIDWGYFNSINLVLRSNVLQYGTFPLHDPWICGGVDLSSNPNIHNFSPRLLLDLLFIPEISNLWTLFITAAIGFFGASLWFVRHCKDSLIASLMAFLYINSSYFGLHFAVGHIPYCGFQFLPLLFYFAESASSSARSFFALCSLLSFLLINAEIYPLFFFLTLLPVYLLVMGRPLAFFRKKSAKELLVYVLSPICFLLIGCVKVIPVLSFHGHRAPLLDRTVIPIRALIQVFFNPFVPTSVQPDWAPWGFHEFGCYFGIFSILIVLWGVLKRRKSESRRFGLLMLFLLWTGTGWGDPVNPWFLAQKLPLLNNAHAQSRVLIFAYAFFLVLLGKSLVRFQRPVIIGLSMLLCVEAMTAKSYPIVDIFKAKGTPLATRALIKSTSIVTVKDSEKPAHYLLMNRGSVRCYDSLEYQTSVLAYSDPSYRGEVYVESGTGTVKENSYTPGRISVSYSCESSCEIKFNTNFLGGWSSDDPKLESFSYPDGLLGLRVPKGAGQTMVRYSPRYWPTVVILYILGLLLWLVLFRLSVQTESRFIAPTNG